MTDQQERDDLADKIKQQFFAAVSGAEQASRVNRVKNLDSLYDMEGLRNLLNKWPTSDFNTLRGLLLGIKASDLWVVGQVTDRQEGQVLYPAAKAALDALEHFSGPKLANWAHKSVKEDGQSTLRFYYCCLAVQVPLLIYQREVST